MSNIPEELQDSEFSRDLVTGWSPNSRFEFLQVELVGSTRWSLNYQAVVLDHDTGQHYKTNYSIGSTEEQDERPFEYDPPAWVEVFPVLQTVTVYMEKDE